MRKSSIVCVMVLIYELSDPRLSGAIAAGGVAVIRTDTLYGVVASAINEQAVESIYRLKSRQPDKQLIVLIGSISQLFDTYSDEVINKLDALWPGKNSIVLPSTLAPAWLLRGGDSIAYRLPDDEKLRELLNQTGPLVAPSANPESLTPAMSVGEAVGYFGDRVDVYVDGGVVRDDSPSSIYQLTDAGFTQLR